ncbi:hypothetical protein KP77_19870 [Jeotgalibacillus alimentarius]|uniref:DUF1499 domain-containing protein n=1 Tax=Jeotgalibacillus alimentarius TaxID=135826 RepID=A0A0C2VWJ0_9BACL|nr:DUF1499 domain-containing protein [Jeotgalibacillus alimentarius]KIL48776.1 hypothetical protein KP77_19870 [Jeotgalibacillus alimentarius]
MNLNERLENGKLLPLKDKPNNVSTQTDHDDKRMEPFPYRGSKEESKKRIKSILESMNNIVIKNENDQMVYAIATSSFFKFKDDIDFLFSDEEQVIHYRSASRVGYSDMGVNKKRMNTIRELYMEEI